jgi:NADH-quinone oxidoreductase subunit J
VIVGLWWLIIPQLRPLFEVLIFVLADKCLWILTFFYNHIIPALIVLLSISVMFFRNPIYSLLALITVFFLTAIILLSLKIEFLAMIFLIIYIGAIAILFLFVIMMFNLRTITNEPKPTSFYFSLFFYSFILVPKFYFCVINQLTSWQTSITSPSLTFSLLEKKPVLMDILIFSSNFYTAYAHLFIMLGFVLLTSMVGAIVLALSAQND